MNNNLISVKHRNLGTINQNCVTISTNYGSVDLYFSYETIVAVDGVVSQNNWSKTTGKLLNDLQPDKEQRVEYDIVLKEVEKRLKNLFYSQKEQIAEVLTEQN
jgi:hypothetical protein